MKFPRRMTFEFNHPEQTGPIRVKAWTEAGAWKKVRAFVRGRMFGDFALTYEPSALERVMSKITCSRVPTPAESPR